jgi:hypothetical protein
MAKPNLADYVNIFSNLLDKFMQHHIDFAKKEIRYIYKHKVLILFFMLMQFRRIYQFKAQRRWLENHPEERKFLGFSEIPHRTTLSRRYKWAYPLICEFVAFLGTNVEPLDEAFAHKFLFEDKSLFKAKGPVWHKCDQEAGHIPEKLRNLDTDATWSKSGYQGWVYGYSLHVTTNQSAFPKLLQVETAKVSEKQVITKKEKRILNRLKPLFFTGDNSYFKAMRIRDWAKKGIALITPAFQWVKGKYAQAYHQFINQPEIHKLFTIRKTTVEPLFDLVAQIIGATGRQKQLPVQGKPNVSACLALGTLTLQISMIVNNIWAMPLRNIGHMKAVFT